MSEPFKSYPTLESFGHLMAETGTFILCPPLLDARRPDPLEHPCCPRCGRECANCNGQEAKSIAYLPPLPDGKLFP